MTISDWIALGSISLIWAGSLIGLWVQIKIKLAELEIKINNNKEEFNQHCKWGEAMQAKNEKEMKSLEYDSKVYNKEMNQKLDKILDRLNDFMIYVEQKIK